jgi:hypothetical protein
MARTEHRQWGGRERAKVPGIEDRIARQAERVAKELKEAEAAGTARAGNTAGRLGRAVYTDLEPDGWPSVRAASIALGCNRRSLKSILSLRSGTYVGRRWAFVGQELPPKVGEGRRAIVCREDPGRSWPTTTACAAEFGVSDQTIRRRHLDGGHPIGGVTLIRGPDWGTYQGRWRASRDLKAGRAA